MENKLRNYTIPLMRVPKEKNRQNEGETTIKEVVAQNLSELRDSTCPWLKSTKFQIRKTKLNPHLDTS